MFPTEFLEKFLNFSIKLMKTSRLSENIVKHIRHAFVSKCFSRHCEDWNVTCFRVFSEFQGDLHSVHVLEHDDHNDQIGDFRASGLDRFKSILRL